MTFRIAIVQPISHRPGEDERNVADAVSAIEHAAHEGADFVCFPETYPGPWRMPATFDPTAAMAEAAATHGVHVVFGTIEPIDRKAATAYNLIVMAYPDGRAPARYRRTHPNGPWIYTGGKDWEFQYTPGNDFPVFDTAHGKVGLAMCSEVYMPEVTRALALARRRTDLHAGGHRQEPAVGDVADLDLGARHRESCHRGDDAKSVRSRPARARHGGDAGGDRVREHGRRHEPGRCQPRSRAPAARRSRRRSARRPAAAPSKACSARNGSGRSFTTRSIRGRCAKRLSDRSPHRARTPRTRPATAPRLHGERRSIAPPTAATTTRRWRNFCNTIAPAATSSAASSW